MASKVMGTEEMASEGLTMEVFDKEINKINLSLLNIGQPSIQSTVHM